jgi:hypothetical protein
MKDAGEAIAVLTAELRVNYLEVSPSPMLDLVELREERTTGDQRWVRTTYLDRVEADRLAVALAAAGTTLAAEVLAPSPAPELPRYELAYLVATNDQEAMFSVWDASKNFLLANRWPLNNRQVAIEAIEGWNRESRPGADITPINRAGGPEESA